MKAILGFVLAKLYLKTFAHQLVFCLKKRKRHSAGTKFFMLKIDMQKFNICGKKSVECESSKPCFSAKCYIMDR